MNNLEASDVVKSSHFNTASKLLEVCDVSFFPLLKCKAKGSNLSCSFTLFVPNTIQVNSKELEKCLTQRSIMTTRESVTKTLTISQAVDGKDAFVKVTFTSVSHMGCPRPPGDGNHWSLQTDLAS